MTEDGAEGLLRAMFDAAVAAADPMALIPDALPPRPDGRVLITGAGKASARMAEAVAGAWGADLEGLVVTRYGHARPAGRIEIVEAAHPVPDQAGMDGARRMLAAAADLGQGDLMLALVSGGGSALQPLPAEGITLDEKQAINRALLASGAPIGAMNVVRKHLSRIKGGRLAAAAYPARTLALMISDVPGDDPGTIASGPTVGEASTPADALAILERYGIEPPESVRRHLSRADGAPGPEDARLSRTENRIIAAPQLSLEAAARVAREAGVTPVILGDAIEGEAREVATVMAGIARQVLRHDQPAPRPCVLLSGGETTVTVRGRGRGGRNVEFMLALAIALRGAPVHAIACDTDGVDGAEEIAGAVIGPGTLGEAAEAGIFPLDALTENDAHTVFERLGCQVVTGPTLTNVNDFRAILIP